MVGTGVGTRSDESGCLSLVFRFCPTHFYGSLLLMGPRRYYFFFSIWALPMKIKFVCVNNLLNLKRERVEIFFVRERSPITIVNLSNFL